MEMIRAYIGVSQRWKPRHQYTYSITAGSFKVGGVVRERKAQELVRRYILLQEYKKNPMLFAA